MSEPGLRAYGTIVLGSLMIVGCCPSGSRTGTANALDAEGAEFVQVDWLGQNSLYVGRVVARRDELVGIQYADGSREWADAERVQPLALEAGQRVRVRWARHVDREWDGEVIGVRDDLIEVRFDNGRGETWVSLSMVTRVLEGETSAEEQQQTQVQPGQEQASPPPPPPVDPSRLSSGRVAIVLHDGSRYGVILQDVGRERVRIRWLSSNTEEWVPISRVVQVYDGDIGDLGAGDRVRYYASSDLTHGFVLELRGDFILVGNSGANRGDWVLLRQVVERITGVDPRTLSPGRHVGVLWHNQIWGATVVEINGGNARIRWDQGGSLESVPVDTIVEVW